MSEFASGVRWVVYTSSRGKPMVIEEDGTEDGRLVADRLTEKDAKLIAAIPELLAEIARLRRALRIIAGQAQCVDNLMSNPEIALAALKENSLDLA